MPAVNRSSLCEVPVFFATTEGQTRRIAERLAAILRDHGLASCAIDMAGPGAARIDWTPTLGALVGASLHRGRHQEAAERFVRKHAAALNQIPSAFFSVSLSAASKNTSEFDAAERLARALPADHGWRPAFVLSVAGRLAYRQYGFLTRLVMKQIARREGAPTDTSRDYELTNWDEVTTLAREMAHSIRAPAAVA